MCCMDAEDYSDLPLRQYEEDNILRELNKALIGFLQPEAARRLSPIGESFSSTPPEQQEEAKAPDKTLLQPPSPPVDRRGRFITLGSSGEQLPVHQPCRGPVKIPSISRSATTTSTTENRRSSSSGLLKGGGRTAPLVFSVKQSSIYTSCHSESSEDEFHSARTSFEKEDKEEGS